MLRRQILLAASVLALTASAAATSKDAAEPRADKQHIRAHLTFLADDLLEGREAGTRGFDIAAQYVAAQFMQYGVQPKGEQGGFMQPVLLKGARLVQESPRVEIVRRSGAERLTYLDDYTMGASLLEDASAVEAPLVFVGYGIEADRFQHHDYANVDVKGKIVVMLSGRPSNMPSEEGAHFGNANHKRSMAATRGAVGIITLQTPFAEKSFPFAKNREYRYAQSMTWIDRAGKPAREFPGVQNRLGLSLGASAKLFTEVDARLTDIYAAAEANLPVPHMDLNLSLRMARQSVRSDSRSSNVIGMIEGSDPQLRNEYVVFSAHLDHLGVVKEKLGDNIFNGAMDNGSGVSIMLETARLFAQLETKPKRSLLFVAVTGEEKGLLGSDFFASNPTVPPNSLVADINLDMPLLTFDFSDVIAHGAEHSSMKRPLSAALRKMNLGLIADPSPEQGLFTRSDQYSFVRQGIPAISLKTGLGSFNKSENPAELLIEFRKKHYHQPSDDLSLPFNFDAAARFAQMSFSIGLELANDAARPTWNAGDFFGETFRK